MITKSMFNFIWGLQDCSHLEKLVLINILSKMKRNKNTLCVSKSEICNDLGILKNSTKRALGALKEKGLIIDTGEKIRQVPVYAVNRFDSKI